MILPPASVEVRMSSEVAIGDVMQRLCGRRAHQSETTTPGVHTTMLAVSPHDFHRRPGHHTIRRVAREEQARASSGSSSRTPLGRGLDAIRADHLRAQAVRFVLAGGIAAVVYIAITTFLAEALHLQFQIALVIGWLTGVGVHFELQRKFVWAPHETFALPIGHQILLYLLMCGSQFALMLASTAVLPGVLGVPVEIVYLASTAVLALVNFVMFRNKIFHAGPLENSNLRLRARVRIHGDVRCDEAQGPDRSLGTA